MVEHRQKGITKAYRNDKKDFDTSERGEGGISLSSILILVSFSGTVIYQSQ